MRSIVETPENRVLAIRFKHFYGSWFRHEPRCCQYPAFVPAGGDGGVAAVSAEAGRNEGAVRHLQSARGAVADDPAAPAGRGHTGQRGAVVDSGCRRRSAPTV